MCWSYTHSPNPFLGRILHTDFLILHYINLKMTHVSTLVWQHYPVTAAYYTLPYVKIAWNITNKDLHSSYLQLKNGAAHFLHSIPCKGIF